MAVWRDWRSAVTFSEDGPGVTLLHESPELKVVLVARRRAGPAGSHGPSALFHFLDGEGVMTVGTEAVEVAAGATVVVPTGASRGLRATSRLVFLGNLGDPASENGPHLVQQQNDRVALHQE
jgi:mannose-6-phosphate isomerase-like protein (cupin superfamily)